jgi:uncharacterized protein (TIGR02301 family)
VNGEPQREGSLLRPQLAASVGVFRDGRVLLAERLAEPARGLFTFPGGRVEMGETLEEAALRELDEEVGVKAAIVGFVAHVEAIHRDQAGRPTFHTLICAFAARWTAGEPRSSAEAGRLVWVAPDEVGRLPTTKGLPAIVRKAAAMIAAGVVWAAIGLMALAPPAAAQTRPPSRPPAQAPTPPPPPPEPPPAPYEPQVLRLAELLGALAYLTELCRQPDAALWPERMSQLIEAEGTTPDRRERLAGAYNAGYRGYQQVYPVCTDNARLVIDRALDEGQRIARDLASRYSG